jgi:hypothetical protein
VDDATYIALGRLQKQNKTKQNKQNRKQRSETHVPAVLPSRRTSTVTSQPRIAPGGPPHSIT